MPANYLPRQISAFYLFWYKPNEKDLASITVCFSERTASDPEFNLLQAVVEAFNIEDVDDAGLTFLVTQMEVVYQEMTLPSDAQRTRRMDSRGFLERG